MEDPAARSPHFNGGLARLGARLLNYVVAIYLIFVGLVGLFA
jgi:hypothetical protein